MSQGTARGRWLVALAMAVLAGHVLLLRPPKESVRAPESRARPFLTRTVAMDLAPAAVPAIFEPAPVRPAKRVPLATVGREAASMMAATDRARTEPAKPTPQNSAPAAAAAAAPASTPIPAPMAAPDAGAQPAAFRIPGSVRLQYRVNLQIRGLAWQARSQLEWRHDGDSYDARLEVSAPLLPTRWQRSTGRITAEGLAPLRFADKGRSEEATHFERDKGKVTFSSNRPDAPLLAGAQDRLSVLLQLGAMIAGEPAKFPRGTTITFQTAGTHDSEPWLFTVEGPETLHLPGGQVEGLKLIRNPRKEFDLKVELWLAPGMDYVPIRLRLTQPNGDWVDQQWSSTDKG